MGLDECCNMNRNTCYWLRLYLRKDLQLQSDLQKFDLSNNWNFFLYSFLPPTVTSCES